MSHDDPWFVRPRLRDLLPEGKGRIDDGVICNPVLSWRAAFGRLSLRQVASRDVRVWHFSETPGLTTSAYRGKAEVNSSGRHFCFDPFGRHQPPSGEL
jgi:hypothetical protein